MTQRNSFYIYILFTCSNGCCLLLVLKGGWFYSRVCLTMCKHSEICICNCLDRYVIKSSMHSTIVAQEPVKKYGFKDIYLSCNSPVLVLRIFYLLSKTEIRPLQNHIYDDNSLTNTVMECCVYSDEFSIGAREQLLIFYPMFHSSYSCK